MSVKPEKGFSVITNFGCSFNCWYCIWKNHPLQNCHVETDWHKLDRILNLLPINKISISGGGDPFYNLENNKVWWEKLFSLASKNRKSVDVHTAQLISDKNFIRRFHKYVLHLDWERFIQLKSKLIDFPISLRLVFVATPELKIEQMEQILSFAKPIKCQLTFRELYPTTGNFLALEKKLDTKDAEFIYQDDYNLYFMPDNKVYENFLLKRKAIY